MYWPPKKKPFHCVALKEERYVGEGAGGPDQPQVLVNQALEHPASVLAGGKRRMMIEQTAPAVNVHPNMDMNEVLNDDSFVIGGREMTLAGNLGMNYCALKVLSSLNCQQGPLAIKTSSQ